MQMPRCALDLGSPATLVSIISSLGNYQNRPTRARHNFYLARDVEPRSTRRDDSGGAETSRRGLHRDAYSVSVAEERQNRF